MSVLSCCRNNCNNVMCDRLSHKHGYICNDCFGELRGLPGVDIGEFMMSKKTKKVDYFDWDEIINDEFEVN